MGHPNLQLLDPQPPDFHYGLFFRIEKRGKQESPTSPSLISLTSRPLSRLKRTIAPIVTRQGYSLPPIIIVFLMSISIFFFQLYILVQSYLQQSRSSPQSAVKVRQPPHPFPVQEATDFPVQEEAEVSPLLTFVTGPQFSSCTEYFASSPACPSSSRLVMM